MGTLACITAGFEVIARNLYLATIPALLDLFLWLGPRLSVAPIIDRVGAYLVAQGLSDKATAEMREMAIVGQQALVGFGGEANLFGGLSPGPLLGVPSLLALRPTLERPFGLRPDITISSVPLMLGCLVALVVIGLAVNALYLRVLGHCVVDEMELELTGPGAWQDIWKQLLLLTFVVGVYVFGSALVASAVSTLFGLFNRQLGGFLLTLVFSFMLFTLLHLVFVVPAVVQLRRPLLQAVRESLLLTRADFMSVSTLLLLVFVVSQGLRFVWNLPNPDSWAMVVGIGGHAFVSSALTAALFIFYQERLGFLRTLEQIRATRESPVHPIVGK